MGVQLELEEGNWYAWEITPGYSEKTYYSPIKIERVRQTSFSPIRYEMEMFNALYAQGVRNFRLDLVVAQACHDALAAYISYGAEPDLSRQVTIRSISWEWIGQHMPRLSQAIAEKMAKRNTDMGGLLDGINW